MRLLSAMQQGQHRNGRYRNGSMRILHRSDWWCYATIRKSIVMRIVVMTNLYRILWSEQGSILHERFCINGPGISYEYTVYAPITKRNNAYMHAE